MKKVLISSLGVLLLIVSTNVAITNSSARTGPSTAGESAYKFHIEMDGKISNRDELIAAIIYVESKGDECAVGDTYLPTSSIGCMQIRRVMVNEVNHILQRNDIDKHYMYDDRFNRNNSIEMFNIWADAHHKDSSFERMARNWNGGPNGYKKEQTITYWERVSTYAKNNF